MISIHYLRAALQEVVDEDVFLDLEPDLADSGPDDGVSTLWSGEEEAEEDLDYRDSELPVSQGAGVSARPSLEEIFEYGTDIDDDLVKGVLEGPGGEALRRASLIKGMEAYGAYLSFHVRGAQWGIYIRDLAIEQIAHIWLSSLQVPIDVKRRIAFRIIHQHELFHFAVDYFTAQVELLLRTPCWLPGRELRRGEPPCYSLEEQLATAHQVRSLRPGPRSLRAQGRAAALKQFIDLLPLGYRDAYSSVRDVSFHRDVRRMVREYLFAEGVENSPCNGFEDEAVDYALLLPIGEPELWRYCPVHRIHDGERYGLPPLDIDLFETVCGIREEAGFSRALRKLDARVRRDWENTKKKLAQGVSRRGLDFKLWRPERESRVYSVRVNGAGYRAHVQFKDGQWEAIGIGDHKKMGHG